MPSRKTNAANLYGGGATPLQFTHTQTVAASTWTIDHNFGVPGSLRAVAYDNGGIWMPIVGIQAVGENQAVVTFDQPRAGRVDVFADDAYEFNAVKVHSQIDLAGLELTVSQQGRLLANGVRLVTENELGANGLSPLFSDVRGKPTTLAGYGITDGVQSLIEPSSELAWKDITSELFARTSGSAAPSLSLFRGMLYAWQFSPTTTQSLYATFHVPHDYAPGTPIRLHVHWSGDRCVGQHQGAVGVRVLHRQGPRPGTVPGFQLHLRGAELHRALLPHGSGDRRHLVPVHRAGRADPRPSLPRRVPRERHLPPRLVRVHLRRALPVRPTRHAQPRAELLHAMR